MATDDAPESDNEAQISPQELPSISLVDHTAPAEELASDAELSRSPTSITKTLTQGSLRQTIARRKYQRSKWQEGRGSQSYIKFPPDAIEEGEGSTSDQPKDPPLQSQSQDGSDSDTWGKGRVRRGGQKVKDAIRIPKQKGSKPQINDPDSHVDILYENQRGFFFAGIPRFSSNSLLNFDSSAWLDSRYRPSAVNITNAQVPDPSWEWSWRCWYVDMSGDVDEEGWEYSFWFGKGTAWHGTHPWFHSFVRRRRWLRKRSKRKGVKPKEEAHALTSDYFTIHSKTKPTEEDSDSMATSEKRGQYSVATSNAWGAKSWEDQTDITEITNIPDLIRSLKAAAIDREKIILVRRFIDHGGEELHYLAENMEHIMKLLVFQNSRRQLLSILMHEFEAAEKHRDEHEERGEEESEDERRHIDNLLKAVEAADEQCKQLEYWSDIRDMARDGEILRASDHTHGWGHGWQGLDASGPDERVGSPTDGQSDNENASRPQDKGKQPARETDEIGISGGWADGVVETEGSNAMRISGDDASRPSTDSARRDVFYSPEEEKTQSQAMNLLADAENTPPVPEVPTPSQESQLSLDIYESAHSEPEDDDEDDGATERAPSEHEDELDSPPVGTTPIEGLTKAANGHSKEDKGTTSRKSDQ